MTNLSIIILSFNTQKLTIDCVETALASLDMDPSIKAEIIVLDNDSSDGSVEALKKIKDERLSIIASKENTGFTKGNNIAVKEAKGDIVLFLNSDIVVLEDAIPRLYHYFLNQKNFAFVGGKLLNKDGSFQASAGRFYTPLITFAALFLKGDSWGASRWPITSIKKVDWTSGACFITKKETYEKLGGFDESIFMYWDEIDLFYRASKKGLHVGSFPDATFIHLEGASSRSDTELISRIFKGYILFYKKHYSPLQLVVVQYMLQLKSLIVIIIGKLTGNAKLVETYSRGYEIAKKN